jgi:16S rRNA G966 N2-methylase RsmD
MGLMPDCFAKIREHNRLAEDGIIVAEHGEREILDDELSGFVKIKEKKYGSIVVSIYGHNA